MDGQQAVDGLELEDELLLDNEVHAIAAFEPYRLVDDRQRHLPRKAQTAVAPTRSRDTPHRLIRGVPDQARDEPQWRSRSPGSSTDLDRPARKPLCLCVSCSTSSRHQVDEAVEQVVAVLRAGRGFGVVLHREDRLVLQAQAFVGAVEQRDVRRPRRPAGSASGIDDEAVVLAGDLDLAGGEVLDRMVGAAMAARPSSSVWPPSASASIWWPRQMPKIGMPRRRSGRWITGTA